ncbi:MAG: patatin-like phospholipase family protein [Clostridia bacterium]|nr:patatin-like phospholipase family protein [Clostridia bacterium]
MIKKNFFHKNTFGLVLAGGGTKGAYQVGVIKALKKLKLPISTVVGTSIGAINGAFMLQKDFTPLETLYDNLKIDDVMKLTGKVDESKNIFHPSNLLALLTNIAEQGGIENAPLRELLEENLNIEEFYQSPVDFGLATYSVKEKQPLHLFKKEIPKDKLIDYILASACFPIFKKQKIGNEEYLDGGLSDNTPINMLVEKGYENIIVADIAGIGFHQKMLNKNIYLKILSPSEDLGGTFEFEQRKIRNNMALGYLDTMRAFNHLRGNIYYFPLHEFDKLLKYFSLQTIHGLEIAAEFYDIDKYQEYTFEDFLSLLHEKHTLAQEKYNRIKTALRNSKLPELKKALENDFEKELILCLATDLYLENPLSQALSYLKPYLEDEFLTIQAMIEFMHFYK